MLDERDGVVLASRCCGGPSISSLAGRSLRGLRHRFAGAIWTWRTPSLCLSSLDSPGDRPARLKKVEEETVPSWLWRSIADESALEALPEKERVVGEQSSKQVFDRLAGTWTYWGWKGGYFDSEADAQAFFDEQRFMLAAQMVAPNSPQWFNTGLHWAYGIDGPGQGHYYVDFKTGKLTKSKSSYEHPRSEER